MIAIREQDATIPADASRPPKPLITPTSDSTGPRCKFCADRSQNTAQAGQRGGRGEGGQAAGPAIPILRLPNGTPNLSWIDPSQKGYWRSEMHWEYGREQIDPKAREEGLPYQPWAKITYMNGRPHPKQVEDLPTWLGHSVGHWEGNNLVVDAVGFNEGHWLDRSGDVTGTWSITKIFQ